MGTSFKTIAVVGATGKQGEKAKSLAILGAEVVEADPADAVSYKEAMKGAHAVYVNTDMWETYRREIAAGNAENAGKTAYEAELCHAKVAADAAASTPTVQRYIYSALGPIRKVTGGKFSSYHWTSKEAARDYIVESLPGPAQKTSFIYIGAYIDNAFLLPKCNAATGRYELALPGKQSARYPIADPAQVSGEFVRALIEDEEPQTTLLAYNNDSFLDCHQLARAWSKATAKEVDVVEVSVDEMKQRTGLPMEILEGPVYLAQYHYMEGLEFIEPASLKNPIVTVTYEEWLQQQGNDFLLGSKWPGQK